LGEHGITIRDELELEYRFDTGAQTAGPSLNRGT
jgi:hypothetical protein